MKMVSCESKSGMVIAGRGARACDMCGKERARWYCAADEAYLCEKCDGSVHSANSVARRHDRVKLGPNGAPVKMKPSSCNHLRKNKTINLSSLENNNKNTPLVPKLDVGDQQKWFRSSKKRPRTPRSKLLCTINSRLAPEMTTTSIIKEETDDTILLYDLLTADDDQFGDIPVSSFDVKLEPISPSSTLTTKEFTDMKTEDSDSAHEVPTYEPLLEELIAISDDGDFMDRILPPSSSFSDANCTTGTLDASKHDVISVETCKESNSAIEANNFQPCEFVEGSIVEDGSNSVNDDSDMDAFDVMDLCSDGNFDDDVNGEKFEDGLPDMDSWAVYAADQSACTPIFEGNPFKGKGERELDMISCMKMEEFLDGGIEQSQCFQQPAFNKSLSLRLDYEEVLNAWSDRGSLWTDGQRPQIVPDVCYFGHGNLEQCGPMIMMGESSSNSTGCQAGQVPLMVHPDSGREARVLRYREKRRTRLFSKKIRYEVRKLNAERRPRMKGRFVKRSAIAVM